MFGLKFSLAATMNVAAAGFIGAAVTLFVAWLSTQELRGHIYESFDREAQLLELISEGIPFTLRVEEDTGRVTGYTVYDQDIREAKATDGDTEKQPE